MVELRAMVLRPQEQMDTWIKFAALCRKSGRLELTRTSLSKLLPDAEGAAAGNPPRLTTLPHALLASSKFEELLGCPPPLLYAYAKYLWVSGEQQTAIELLQRLLHLHANEPPPPPLRPIPVKTKSAVELPLMHPLSLGSAGASFSPDTLPPYGKPMAYAPPAAEALEPLEEVSESIPTKDTPQPPPSPTDGSQLLGDHPPPPPGSTSDGSQPAGSAEGTTAAGGEIDREISRAAEQSVLDREAAGGAAGGATGGAEAAVATAGVRGRHVDGAAARVPDLAGIPPIRAPDPASASTGTPGGAAVAAGGGIDPRLCMRSFLQLANWQLALHQAQHDSLDEGTVVRVLHSYGKATQYGPVSSAISEPCQPSGI